MSELKIISGTNKVKTRIIYKDISADIDVLAEKLNMREKGMKNRLAKFRRGEITAEQVMKPLSDNADAVINLTLSQLKSNPDKQYTAKQMAEIICKDGTSTSNALCQLYRQGNASKEKGKDCRVYYQYKEFKPEKNGDSFNNFLRVMAKNRSQQARY